MEKRLRIGFYKVEVGPQGTKFRDVLECFEELPDNEKRTMQRGDNSARLQRLNHGTRLWNGDMLRIRMGEAPKKAKLNGEVEPIEFEKDEGLGESSAFRYDPMTGILLYHEHRGGVSRRHFEQYCKKFGGKLRSVTLKPLLRPNALERVIKMRRIRSLKIQIAGIDQFPQQARTDSPAADLFQLADRLRAPEVLVEARCRKNDPSLSRDHVVGFVTYLKEYWEHAEREVRKVVVEGGDLGDETEVVDLLADRLVEHVPVELKTGTITDKQRFEALGIAWERNQEQLEEYYTQDGR